MLKVRLLNDGGYVAMEDVEFPVIVYGEDCGGKGCDILGSELIWVGANTDDYVLYQNCKYFFEYGTECEVVDEE